MLLPTLLYKVPGLTATAGPIDVDVSALVIDSRRVTPGSLFAALPGTQVDGHQFIPKAIESGATAILCEKLPDELAEKVSYVRAADAARALGFIASNFYENPSAKLKLVGVTGTNGKTSTATLLFRLFRRRGYRCGLISTVQNQIDETVFPSTHTTRDTVALNALLAEMVKRGCSHAFMEVS